MIYAIDCDLRESFMVNRNGFAWRGATPWDVCQGLIYGPDDIVLFEIASPVSFNRGHGSNAAMTQLAKWALWNVAWAATLARHAEAAHPPVTFLVAPSNVWTKGYEEKTRHKIAGAVQKKKDLRECEAMLFFHNLHPEDWVPLHTYLESF